MYDTAVSDETYIHGTIVTLTCNEGFESANSNVETAECTSGEWAAASGTCVGKQTPFLPGFFF